MREYTKDNEGAIDDAEKRVEEVIQQHRPTGQKSQMWIEPSAYVSIRRAGCRVDRRHSPVTDCSQGHCDHGEEYRIDRVPARSNGCQAEHRHRRARCDRDNTVENQITQCEHPPQTRNPTRIKIGGSEIHIQHF